MHVIRAVVSEHMASLRAGAAVGGDENVSESDMIAASQRPGSAVHVGNGQDIAAGSDAPLLVVARPVVHSISAPVSVILSGSASSQKSFLCEFTTDFLQHSRHAPTCIADGSAFLVESSAKGIRTCILNHGRCSATSDEIVNTFPTPWGDQKQSGVHAHLLCRSKLNTYTQCERDDVITANGPIHLKGYSFQLKVFGQHAPCEWVLRPTDNGWQKRPSVSFAPNKSPMDEDVNADMSTGMWQGVHDWMFAGPSRKPAYLHYDEFALGMYPVVVISRVDFRDFSHFLKFGERD